MKIKRLLEIGIINTLRFNLHYFSGGGNIPQVILSKNVKLGRLKGKVVINGERKSGNVKIGFDSVSIFDRKHERSIWDNDGTIILGDNVNIGQGVRISNHGTLLIDDNVTISANASIICANEINIEKGCLISWDVLIMDTDSHEITSLESGRQINFSSPITIEENVWISCRCTILKGTMIGKNNVVAAGSIVSGTYNESNVIYSTNKKIIKRGISWKK